MDAFGQDDTVKVLGHVNHTDPDIMAAAVEDFNACICEAKKRAGSDDVNMTRHIALKIFTDEHSITAQEALFSFFKQRWLHLFGKLEFSGRNLRHIIETLKIKCNDPRLNLITMLKTVSGKRVSMVVLRDVKSENHERCIVHPDRQAAFVKGIQYLFKIKRGKLCNGCWLRLAKAKIDNAINPKTATESELIDFLRMSARLDPPREVPGQIQFRRSSVSGFKKIGTTI